MVSEEEHAEREKRMKECKNWRKEREREGRSGCNSISGVLHKSGCVTSVGRAVSLPSGR